VTEPAPCSRCARLEALLREVAEALAEQSLGCSCRACQEQRSLVDRARETLNGGS
jgi:hypothetical protein